MLSRGNRGTIVWIPEHPVRFQEGNERADELARLGSTNPQKSSIDRCNQERGVGKMLYDL